MGCQDCGLDLRVDGFEARPLKSQAGAPEGQTVCGLFCPECVARYDTFAVAEGESATCAECGVRVPAGELRLRSQNRSEVAGAVVWSQTQFVGLCPVCAARADGGSSAFPMPVIVIGAGFLAAVMAAIFFGPIVGVVAFGLGLLALAVYTVKSHVAARAADLRNRWTCSRCGHLNSPSSRACRSCGLET
jgi:hypothetical protein